MEGRWSEDDSPAFVSASQTNKSGRHSVFHIISFTSQHLSLILCAQHNHGQKGLRDFPRARVVSVQTLMPFSVCVQRVSPHKPKRQKQANVLREQIKSNVQ